MEGEGGAETLAAQVMHLAYAGRCTDAREVADSWLLEHRGPAPLPLAYALLVVAHAEGSVVETVAAARVLADRARAEGSPGWVANALAVRAVGLVRAGRSEEAVDDLFAAQGEVAAAETPGLASWAHTGMGYAAHLLRLYEVAVRHFELAVAESQHPAYADPVPIPASPVVDRQNLAEVHLQWVDELLRLGRDSDDPDVVAHRRAAEEWAAQGAAVLAGLQRHGEVPDAQRWWVVVTWLRAAARVDVDPQRSAQLLGDCAGSLLALGLDDEAAQVLTAQARALGHLGQWEEAASRAECAVALLTPAVEWPVAASARHTLVAVRAHLGDSSAQAALTYGHTLSEVMWQQRVRTLDGLSARSEVRRLAAEREADRREARVDALTLVGNRRAMDEALADLQRGLGLPATLVVVDVDDFKVVNDVYGHVVGDEVLRRIAARLSAAARPQDLVVRMGGDELVVLARDTDADSGEALARRLHDILEDTPWDDVVPRLRVPVSVGVATAESVSGVARLLEAADQRMYGDKRRSHA